VVDTAVAVRGGTHVLTALVLATVVPIAVAVALAPSAGHAGSALTLLLFVGSSMHVASTRGSMPSATCACT
jgi:hypothetical protein